MSVGWFTFRNYPLSCQSHSQILSGFNSKCFFNEFKHEKVRRRAKEGVIKKIRLNKSFHSFLPALKILLILISNIAQEKNYITLSLSISIKKMHCSCHVDLRTSMSYVIHRESFLEIFLKVCYQETTPPPPPPLLKIYCFLLLRLLNVMYTCTVPLRRTTVLYWNPRSLIHWMKWAVF